MKVFSFVHQVIRWIKTLKKSSNINHKRPASGRLIFLASCSSTCRTDGLSGRKIHLTWRRQPRLLPPPPLTKKKSKLNLHLRIHLLNWKPFNWEVKDTNNPAVEKKGVGKIFYYISLRMTKIAFSISRSEKTFTDIYIKRMYEVHLTNTKLVSRSLNSSPLIRQENQELPKFVTVWRPDVKR